MQQLIQNKHERSSMRIYSLNKVQKEQTNNNKNFNYQPINSKIFILNKIAGSRNFVSLDIFINVRLVKIQNLVIRRIFPNSIFS